MTHLTPTNWSKPEDDFSKEFYDLYVSQFWLPEEIALADDVVCWRERMTDNERWVYVHASAGLNLLDTLQGEVGMPSLHASVDGHVRKATLQFQGMMEDIHAKSYSLMNKTFLTAAEEDESVQWAATHPRLQKKVAIIKQVYETHGTWQRMAASVVLESALFYSGFFYPLFLAGQGRMTASGEIFSLITRDEACHGAYIGLLAQEQLAQQDNQAELQEWFRHFALELYQNEMAYTEEIYEKVGLVEEVKKFVRYNFNNACDNLGLERLFADEEINPIVATGLDIKRGTHDFFSSKGSSYSKIAIMPLSEEMIRGITHDR